MLRVRRDLVGFLGARWRAETGLSAAEASPGANKGAFAVGIVANIVIAGMTRHIFAAAGVEGIVAGAVSGLGLGLFVGGSFLALNYAFAKRSRALALIDIGHATGVGAVIGAVLAVPM